MRTKPIYKSAAGEQAVMALYDAALARWPLPYTTQMVETDYGRTFTLTCGQLEGPPLVLLHGAGTNSAIWAPDVVVHGRRHRVIAIDLLGEAGKSAANRPAWDSPAYGDWLGQTLDGLGITQTAMMGISQGGWTALQFATAQPQRVTQLALLTPGGVVADKVSFILRAVVLSLLGQWGQKRLLHLLFADQPVPEGTVEILTTVNQHFVSRMGVLPLFSDAELRRLTMPVLLLGGDRDILRDMTKIAGRLRPLLPNLTVQIIPGAGHALLDTAVVVDEFLQGQPVAVG